MNLKISIDQAPNPFVRVYRAFEESRPILIGVSESGPGPIHATPFVPLKISDSEVAWFQNPFKREGNQFTEIEVFRNFFLLVRSEYMYPASSAHWRHTCTHKNFYFIPKFFLGFLFLNIFHNYRKFTNFS